LFSTTRSFVSVRRIERAQRGGRLSTSLPGRTPRCARSIRLTLTEDLVVENNVFVLSGVVDETMLYQVTGEGVNISNFNHRDNIFFNNGREIPVGGLADPNREPGFSNADPKLVGGTGTNYETWMATARSQVKRRGVSLDLSKANEP